MYREIAYNCVHGLQLLELHSGHQYSAYNIMMILLWDIWTVATSGMSQEHMRYAIGIASQIIMVAVFPSWQINTTGSDVIILGITLQEFLRNTILSSQTLSQFWESTTRFLVLGS